LRYGLPQYSKIQPQARIPNIERIPLESAENAFISYRWAVVAFNLGQACDSRLHHVPEFISIHQLRKAGTICMHMRSWSNQAHLSKKDIYELRELVNICIPQKSSNPRNAAIIFFCLPGVAILVHIHGPKLQAKEAFSTPSYPFLPEENRTFGIQADEDSQHRN